MAEELGPEGGSATGARGRWVARGGSSAAWRRLECEKAGGSSGAEASVAQAHLGPGNCRPLGLFVGRIDAGDVVVEVQEVDLRGGSERAGGVRAEQSP